MYYEALQLFIRAADDGISDADYGLGLLFEGHITVLFHNGKTALEHFCKAAKSEKVYFNASRLDLIIYAL